MDDADVKEYLAKTDDRFRELVERHQAYERELEQFLCKPYLNPQEQLKETEIKKKKLFLKDQMQLLISQYNAQHGTS